MTCQKWLLGLVCLMLVLVVAFWMSMSSWFATKQRSLHRNEQALWRIYPFIVTRKKYLNQKTGPDLLKGKICNKKKNFYNAYKTGISEDLHISHDQSGHFLFAVRESAFWSSSLKVRNTGWSNR